MAKPGHSIALAQQSRACPERRKAPSKGTPMRASTSFSAPAVRHFIDERDYRIAP